MKANLEGRSGRKSQRNFLQVCLIRVSAESGKLSWAESQSAKTAQSLDGKFKMSVECAPEENAVVMVWSGDAELGRASVVGLFQEGRVRVSLGGPGRPDSHIRFDP